MEIARNGNSEIWVGKWDNGKSKIIEIARNEFNEIMEKVRQWK